MDLYKICHQKLKYLNYSKNTQKTYLNYIQEFLDSTKKHPSRILAKDIQSYLDSYYFSSVSKQNQVISSLKFMWCKGLGKKYLKVKFTRPRKEKKLPRLINIEEAVIKINNIQNLKHKAILTLGLSCGLRVSEVLNLKPEDIDSSRMVIHIRNAKGRKDRIVPLSKNTLSVINDYQKKYKLGGYLFEGQFGGKYSPTSCNNIMKKYIGENTHYHLLRHSFASYSIDRGTDVSVIQKILGHSDINTTSKIYLHLTNRSFKKVNQPL